jgi:hypothetical protein
MLNTVLRVRDANVNKTKPLLYGAYTRSEGVEEEADNTQMNTDKKVKCLKSPMKRTEAGHRDKEEDTVFEIGSVLVFIQTSTS